MATRDVLQKRPRACHAQQRPVSGRCADAPSILRGEVRRWGELFQIILKNGMLSILASAKVRECYGEVEQEDESRQSIVQDILRGSADFLRETTALVDEMGSVGGTLSCVCPRCHCFPLEDYIG